MNIIVCIEGVPFIGFIDAMPNYSQFSWIDRQVCNPQKGK